MDIASMISSGRTSLGIEFGSTRIKGVLLDESHTIIAQADREWSDHLENGWWSYSLDEAFSLLREVYLDIKTQVEKTYGCPLRKIGTIGISGMMHGFLPFDENDRQLCEFRTWRNTKTAEASAFLSKLFSFNIPQRWSIAHLCQSILNKESFDKDISSMFTLSEYVHYRLTGLKVAGRGEASGMFPLGEDGEYEKNMMASFDSLLKECNYKFRLEDILPKVLCSGENAGYLTEDGAKLLDPSGTLNSGIPFCPPEGDAGTGMVATNSVSVNTGNISAGTSIFLMACLSKPLKEIHPEIDVVATPDGKPVAMVHCNTCTSDLDDWVRLFGEFASKNGMKMDKSQLYSFFYQQALNAEKDCGGLLNYNCFSGEPVCGFSDGRPLFVRKADSKFDIPNFYRSLLYSSLVGIRLGLDIMAEEGIHLDSIVGNGGMFKNPVAACSILSGAFHTKVGVMKTSGEGGPWGMALLAEYARKGKGLSLEKYLDGCFKEKPSFIEPSKEEEEGFDEYLRRYKAASVLEKEAPSALK